MTRIERIEQCLQSKLAPIVCELIDDSAAHAGHAGAASGAGHFQLRIVSEQFRNLNRIARHRLVYAALGALMQTDIHALNIIALTPEEA